MRLSIPFLIVSVGLLSPPVATFQAASPEEQEIAILTIRQDKIRARTTAELLPIARQAGGHFQAIAAELSEKQRSCPESRFRGSHGPGAKYDVFLGGLRIGEAIARRADVGAYSCSALCVVSAETTVKGNLGGRKDFRRGFDPTGNFEEDITQFVALSPSSSRIEFRTVPVEPPSKMMRDSVARLVRTRLLKRRKPDAQTKVQLEDFRLFHSTRAGALHAFVRAAREDTGHDEVKAMTAIVNIVGGRAAEVLLESVSEGNRYRGAANYEFVDAIDLNGDGRSEILVIYHDYEFHEFQFLRLTSGHGRYEVVHKGPTYGC
jgi:hypothetical protein